MKNILFLRLIVLFLSINFCYSQNQINLDVDNDLYFDSSVVQRRRFLAVARGAASSRLGDFPHTGNHPSSVYFYGSNNRVPEYGARGPLISTDCVL